MTIKKYILSIIISLSFSTLMGQDEEYLQNPTLEGDWGTDPNLENAQPTPPFWNSCQMWADPDVLNGTARFRTRAFDYFDGGSHAPSTTEYMINELSHTLEAGGCYIFSAKVRYDPTILSNTQEGDKTSFPVKIELRGATAKCVQTMEEIENLELMGSTKKAIDNTEFEYYEFEFFSEENNYNYLMIRAAWDDSISVQPYNGIIELDEISVKRIQLIQPPDVDTSYYERIPPMQLVAADGKGWEWYPPKYLSNPNIQNPYLLDIDPKDTVYTVRIINYTGCPVYQEFRISYLCDSVYKREFLREDTVYYKIDEDLFLEASEGISYSWDASVIGLYENDYDTIKPRVVSYFDSITVDIVDKSKYACEYKEKFYLVIDCDTLFNQMDHVYYDTIQYGNIITLDAGPGILIDWHPTEWLINPNVPLTEAEPKTAITYTANMTHYFLDTECPRTETFNISMEKFFPNVITPGLKDGANDVFKIPGIHPKSKITIFDKSGSIVFEAENYNVDNNNWWDGISQKTNKHVPSGTYWYVLEEPTQYGTFNVYKDYVLVLW